MFGVHAMERIPGRPLLYAVVVRFDMISIQSAYQMIERRYRMEALERGQKPIFFFFEHNDEVTNPLTRK